MIKIHTTRRRLLMQILFMQCLCALCVLASSQPLPEGWWQQSSPESVLAKAESITRDLSYFRGSKAHLLDDKDGSIEFFQRRTPVGEIETKFVRYLRGRWFSSDYKIKNGTYYVAHGQLIKIQFEESRELEQSLAAKFDHPYDYQILKPKIVGTNDCIVVARIMPPQFLEAMKAVLYKGYSREKKGLLGDKYTRSEKDIYIRKSDGVIIGDVKRNNSGELLDDKLYDVVQVGNPIPDGEFIVPKGPVKIAAALDQFMEINFKRGATNLIRAQEIKWTRRVVMGAMVISLGVLLWFFIKRISSRNTQSIGDSE